MRGNFEFPFEIHDRGLMQLFEFFHSTVSSLGDAISLEGALRRFAEDCLIVMNRRHSFLCTGIHRVLEWTRLTTSSDQYLRYFETFTALLSCVL